MTKNLLLPTLLALVLNVQAQAPITITAAQFPATAASVDQYQSGLAGTAPTPTLGANQRWDYRLVPAVGIPYSTSYSPLPAGTPAFAGAVRTQRFNAALGPFNIPVQGYYGFSTDGFGQLGSTVAAISFPLTATTGGAADALAVPAQTVAVNTLAVPLPLTSTTRLARTNRIVNRSNLTVGLVGISNQPFLYVQRVTTVDSVAGWGTVQIPVAGNPAGSAPVPVLLLRRRYTEVDSFYLSGAPAPAFLLGALGQTQGTVTNQYSQFFYRQNAAQPMMSFFYGSSAFTAPTGVVYSRESNIALATQPARETAKNGLQAWPNPVAPGQPLAFTWAMLPVSQLLHLTVRDMLGRTVATAKTPNGQPASLPALLPGLYLVEAEADGQRASRRVVVE